MSINQINRYHDVINRYELSVFQMPMDTFHLLITIRYFPHSSSTGFVRWIVRLMSHVEQELISLPEHLSSLPVLSGVRVAQSFVFCRYVKWDQWQLLQNGALKSDSTHHFFRNACTKSGSSFLRIKKHARSFSALHWHVQTRNPCLWMSLETLLCIIISNSMYHNKET
jgi:hypothetical protein